MKFEQLILAAFAITTRSEDEVIEGIKPASMGAFALSEIESTEDSMSKFEAIHDLDTNPRFMHVGSQLVWETAQMNAAPEYCRGSFTSCFAEKSYVQRENCLKSLKECPDWVWKLSFVKSSAHAGASTDVCLPAWNHDLRVRLELGRLPVKLKANDMLLFQQYSADKPNVRINCGISYTYEAYVVQPGGTEYCPRSGARSIQGNTTFIESPEYKYFYWTPRSEVANLVDWVLINDFALKGDYSESSCYFRGFGEAFMTLIVRNKRPFVGPSTTPAPIYDTTIAPTEPPVRTNFNPIQIGTEPSERKSNNGTIIGAATGGVSAIAAAGYYFFKQRKNSAANTQSIGIEDDF